EIVTLSAVSSGVADARKVMAGAQGGMFKTVLFVDEVHRWSKAQQDVLLPAVEAGTVTLIGATTENPYFSLVTPLLSRCLLLRLEPLEPGDLRAVMERALDDSDRGLGDLGIAVEEDAIDHLVEIARRMVVHASEDIGLADPRALLVATAAAHAVEYVGLPEARLNLAQAAIYLARAPKSNSVIAALGRAMEDAATSDPVPLHLRDSSGHPGLRKLG